MLESIHMITTYKLYYDGKFFLIVHKKFVYLSDLHLMSGEGVGPALRGG